MPIKSISIGCFFKHLVCGYRQCFISDESEKNLNLISFTGIYAKLISLRTFIGIMQRNKKQNNRGPLRAISIVLPNVNNITSSLPMKRTIITSTDCEDKPR